MDDEKPNQDAGQRLLDETAAVFARYNRGPKESRHNTPSPLPETIDPAPPRLASPPSSQTEITVDLPHGQSLTVRGLDPGAIVEIASWTGTGPPDDDAVRMMFGATRQQPARAEGTRASDLSNSESAVNSGTPDSEATESGDADEATNTRKARTMWKRLGITAAVIGLIAVIIAGLRFTGVASFEHPDGGLTGGLGSAESTFVAISPSASIEPNASVLVTIDGENLIAGVVQVGPDEVLVFTGDGQEVVNASDVLGRVLFVVPFIGYLAG